MDARLAWLSRRGIKELDLVLQGFLQEDYATATATEQQAFAALLEYQDPDILDRLFHGVEDDDAAIAALVLRGLPVYEYTALQVKQAVVGQGKAAKEQVQDMVVRMLGLSGTPQADAADGLAVAITHALRSQGLARQLGGLSIKNGRLR